MDSKKRSLGRTYRANTEANAKVYDLNQKTMKALQTLAMLHVNVVKGSEDLYETDEQFEKDFQVMQEAMIRLKRLNEMQKLSKKEYLIDVISITDTLKTASPLKVTRMRVWGVFATWSAIRPRLLTRCLAARATGTVTHSKVLTGGSRVGEEFSSSHHPLRRLRACGSGGGSFSSTVRNAAELLNVFEIAAVRGKDEANNWAKLQGD